MTERAPADDLAESIEQLAQTHSRLLAVMVALDSYLEVPNFVQRADIQASYLAAASEARALYAAQCAAVAELRPSIGLLSPDQAQVLVVVEFDLARLAKSLDSKE